MLPTGKVQNHMLVRFSSCEWLSIEWLFFLKKIGTVSAATRLAFSTFFKRRSKGCMKKGCGCAHDGLLDLQFRVGHFFRTLHFCIFFASSLLFFFPSTLAPHHEQLTLDTTTLNDEYRVTLSFPLSCPSLYHDQQMPFP
jgi:hypothetical protein